MAEIRPLSGLPFSLDKFINLVRAYGWSFVLAIIAVIIMLGAFPRVEGQLDNIEEGIETVKMQHGVLGEKFDILTSEAKKQTSLQIKICVHGAKSPQDVSDCLQ